MAFVLTVLYFATTYLGTETVFGPLVVYHVELISAVLIVLISLPSLPGSFLLKTPQSLALVGLAFAVFLSVLFTGWVGGAVQAFQSFLPNAFGYFLICLHCNSKRKLQIIVLLLLSVCLFVIGHGVIELKSVNPQIAPDEPTLASLPYLYEHDEGGHPLYRLRGLGFINDPNDFGQLIACTIPLVFIFWRRRKIARNLLVVLLPVCALICGGYFTHSRGFLLALLAVLLMAGRRRIGILPSLLGAGGLFVAASALNFTGGRDISAESGAGRMELWAAAVGVVKSHPLFGVGFGFLPDYIGMTAHNSIMVCAAEVGLFGFYFWSLFLFSTLRDAHRLALVEKVEEADGTALTDIDRFESPDPPAKAVFDQIELRRLGQLMILSFTGFLVTGFFLSRAFVLTLFLLGGIAEVAYQMAMERGIVQARLKLIRVLCYSGVVSASLMLGIYILLHIVYHG